MPTPTYHAVAQACLILILTAITHRPHAQQHHQQEQHPPNVVLIVCDDLNDWIGVLEGHPQAHTPNIDAFAKSAVNFKHAYTNTPVCAPSRASFLTGIYPHTSTNLFWDRWHDNEILANSKTVMTHFKDNGYHVIGAGKLMHHQRPQEWTNLAIRADYGPIAYDGQSTIAHPHVPEPFRDIGSIDGSFGPLINPDDHQDFEFTWVKGRQRNRTRIPFRYINDEDRDQTPDEHVAQWAVNNLTTLSTSDKPFFMGVGFIRPHTPMHAPKEFFDLFPIEEVQVPEILLADEDDSHYRDHYKPTVKGLRYHTEIAKTYASREEGLRHYTQAYLACVAFVDHQIGKVIDAINNSPLADNTIVIITSDHGFNMGEKGFLFKNSLWEESSRIPLLIRAPNVSQPDTNASQPVSLIDIYPTLVDLCNLQGDTRKNDKGRPLDGFSMRPLLIDPASNNWQGPDFALTMLHAEEESTNTYTIEETKDPTKQHWSLRTERWRYIRYNDAQEELYDHHNDPNEWHNLAADPATKPIRKQFETQLMNLISQ